MTGARIWLTAALAVALQVSSAVAEVTRYAVVIGNNRGDRFDADLRYAEDDAAKVQSVLHELGGFAVHNTLLLSGRSADDLRAGLAAINRRIRQHVGNGQRDAVLVVYYSGHADAERLHLGGTAMALTELEQLVGSSGATFRVLILDACRSGALTRVKGGRTAEPLTVSLSARLNGAGTAFLTASTAGEDAQESDSIKGSFFTHYLVSGLIGAADHNRDQQVTLAEAYRHAYDHTLRASSRTLIGAQHPTFRYDLRGRGDLVLTSVRNPGRMAFVEVPERRTYLFMRDGPGGPVVAEIGAHDRVRRIALRPGRYFVRARARRHLLEGAITARAGAVTAIRDDQLQRVAYARLVRKGLGEKRSAHSVSAGALTRTRMLHASVCSGAFADYTMAARRFTVSGRLGYCSGAPEVPFNPADGEPPPDVELAAEFRIGHAWDIASLSIGLDLLGGAVLLADTIQAPEQAIVGRYRLTGLLGSSVNVSRSLYGPLHVRVELGARTYMQRRTVLIFDPNAPTSDESLATTTLVTSVAVSLGAGLGVHF